MTEAPMGDNVLQYKTSDSLFKGHIDVAYAADPRPSCPFSLGDRVKAFGLVKAPQYNGKSGAVIAVDEATRVGVILDDGKGKKLSLRPENLIRLFPLTGGGEAGISDAHHPDGSEVPPKPGALLPIKRPASLRDTDALFCAIEARDSLAVSDRPGWDRIQVLPEFNRCDVVVAPSSKPGAGSGVFSGDRTIAAGQPITQYAGWWVKPDLCTHSLYRLDFMLQKDGPTPCRLCAIGDPAQKEVAFGVAQFINDAGFLGIGHLTDLEDAFHTYEASAAEANVSMRQVDGVLVAFATHDIAPNTELFFSYGPQYWLDNLKLRMEPTHDINMLRKLEDMYKLCDGGTANPLAELTITSESGLCNIRSGRRATRLECEQVLRVAIGGPFHGRNGENLSELACCALLHGAGAEELSEAVYLLKDSGGLQELHGELNECGGYRSLQDRMCRIFKEKLEKAMSAHGGDKDQSRCKAALAMLTDHPTAAMANMYAEGALAGVVTGYNKIIEALERVPDLGALSILSPGVWAASVAALAHKGG